MIPLFTAALIIFISENDSFYCFFWTFAWKINRFPKMIFFIFRKNHLPSRENDFHFRIILWKRLRLIVCWKSLGFLFFNQIHLLVHNILLLSLFFAKKMFFVVFFSWKLVICSLLSSFLFLMVVLNDCEMWLMVYSHWFCYSFAICYFQIVAFILFWALSCFSRFSSSLLIIASIWISVLFSVALQYSSCSILFICSKWYISFAISSVCKQLMHFFYLMVLPAKSL